METISPPPDPFAALDLAAGITITDIVPLLTGLFFLPGDWLLWCAFSYAPGLARFLELSSHGYGGVLAGSLSGLVWLALLVLGLTVHRAVRDVDDALTGWIILTWAEVVRRCRVANRLARHKLSQLHTPARKSAGDMELREDLDLGITELRLLQLHAGLSPGYGLAVGESASTLRAPKHRVRQSLDRLSKLNLLASAFGGPDGESSYRLTDAGRAYLLFRQLAPKRAAGAQASLGAQEGS